MGNCCGCISCCEYKVDRNQWEKLIDYKFSNESIWHSTTDSHYYLSCFIDKCKTCRTVIDPKKRQIYRISNNPYGKVCTSCKGFYYYIGCKMPSDKLRYLYNPPKGIRILKPFYLPSDLDMWSQE